MDHTIQHSQSRGSHRPVQGGAVAVGHSAQGIVVAGELKLPADLLQEILADGLAPEQLSMEKQLLRIP